MRWSAPEPAAADGDVVFRFGKAATQSMRANRLGQRDADEAFGLALGQAADQIARGPCRGRSAR